MLTPKKLPSLNESSKRTTVFGIENFQNGSNIYTFDTTNNTDSKPFLSNENTIASKAMDSHPISAKTNSIGQQFVPNNTEKYIKEKNAQNVLNSKQYSFIETDSVDPNNVALNVYKQAFNRPKVPENSHYNEYAQTVLSSKKYQDVKNVCENKNISNYNSPDLMPESELCTFDDRYQAVIRSMPEDSVIDLPLSRPVLYSSIPKPYSADEFAFKSELSNLHKCL